MIVFLVVFVAGCLFGALVMGLLAWPIRRDDLDFAAELPLVGREDAE